MIRTMKKLLLFLFTIFLLGAVSSFAFAQDEDPGHDLSKQFPVLKFRDYFYQDTETSYYRFPTLVPFFDPLDLGYFPHETWDESDWSLLERWQDTWTYHQMILLDRPAPTWIFHGTDIGKDYGFLDDFYLYATMFVTDTYPDKSGSCYVYYSDSLIKGFGQGTGILVDPQSGIFQVKNTYGATYNLTNKTHELNIIRPFTIGQYPLKEENIELTSYGSSDFTNELMDLHFTRDLDAVKNEFHMPGSNVYAYRLELLREGTNLRVYINGSLAAEIDDGIVSEDKDGNTSPSLVSWSYGPVLYSGGETVTCAFGDLYIYGKARKAAE